VQSTSDHYCLAREQDRLILTDKSFYKEEAKYSKKISEICAKLYEKVINEIDRSTHSQTEAHKRTPSCVLRRLYIKLNMFNVLCNRNWTNIRMNECMFSISASEMFIGECIWLSTTISHEQACKHRRYPCSILFDCEDATAILNKVINWSIRSAQPLK